MRTAGRRTWRCGAPCADDGRRLDPAASRASRRVGRAHGCPAACSALVAEPWVGVDGCRSTPHLQAPAHPRPGVRTFVRTARSAPEGDLDGPPLPEIPRALDCAADSFGSEILRSRRQLSTGAQRSYLLTSAPGRSDLADGRGGERGEPSRRWCWWYRSSCGGSILCGRRGRASTVMRSAACAGRRPTARRARRRSRATAGSRRRAGGLAGPRGGRAGAATSAHGHAGSTCSTYAPSRRRPPGRSP